MSKNDSNSPLPDADKQPQNRLLMIVTVCFFLSGFAALLYQAAWLKNLGIVFGASHVAVATVLAAYMAGLALGSLLAARFEHLIERPVMAYGVLEGVIAVSALLVPVLLGGAQALLVLMFGNQPTPAPIPGSLQTFYYLVAAFCILGIPTAAMGATLPILSKQLVRADRDVGPKIGLLYGINTVGAVFGVLIAGFFLLPYFGMVGTLLIGAGVNAIVFALVLMLPKHNVGTASVKVSDVETNAASISTRKIQFHWIMPLMFASGMVSFALEVLWTRLLSHAFGGTIYAFSIMLASFLTGIALGGFVAGRLSQVRLNTVRYFAITQLLIAAVSFISFISVDALVPASGSLLVKAAYAFFIITPSTIFIGATFPFAVRIAALKSSDTAKTVGAIYAWNTVGAIIGALLTGFYILPSLGFELTLKLGMAVSCVIAFVTLLLSANLRRRREVFATVAVFVAVLVYTPNRPDQLIYANSASSAEGGEEHYYGVGKTSTVLMRELDGFSHLSTDGLSESFIPRNGMPPVKSSQKWLAGLPSLSRPDASSMLIIGYGGGVAIEGVPPSVAEIDVIEIEPAVISANKTISTIRHVEPLNDARVNLILNDARNAMLLTEKRYDIIVSQPSHPWTGGASHLYTKEFLSISKSRLTEGGVFLQWINAEFVDEALLKTLIATMLYQFDNVELYQPERQVLLFVASDAPIGIWGAEESAATALENNRRHFNRLGMRSVEDIAAMLTLDTSGARALAQNQKPNSDNRNVLAFFSRWRGDGLNNEELFDVIGDHDPMVNGNSLIRRSKNISLDYPYVAERLLERGYLRRTSEVAKSFDDLSMRDTINALGFEYSNEYEKAEDLFRSALRADSENSSAQVGLLRLYLSELAQRRLPGEIAQLANQQSGATRAVLEGWVFGAAGAFDRLERMDALLASVEPTSLMFPIAVKLRVDWRVVASQSANDEAIAAEALLMLDDLLASYASLDLYILRGGVAYLARDRAAFVESVGIATRQLQGELDAMAREGTTFPEAEVDSLQRRMAGLRSRLLESFAQPESKRSQEVLTNLDLVMQRLK